MGVDCTFYPLEFMLGDEFTVFTHLRLERRRELWPLIAPLETVAVPKLRGHINEEYSTVTKSPYGEPIKAATAGSLAALHTADAVQDNAMNRAVWAYLAALDPEHLIAIYWS